LDGEGKLEIDEKHRKGLLYQPFTVIPVHCDTVVCIQFDSVIEISREMMCIFCSSFLPRFIECHKLFKHTGVRSRTRWVWVHNMNPHPLICNCRKHTESGLGLSTSAAYKTVQESRTPQRHCQNLAVLEYESLGECECVKRVQNQNWSRVPLKG
jgi:hypothetical protein